MGAKFSINKAVVQRCTEAQEEKITEIREKLDEKYRNLNIDCFKTLLCPLMDEQGNLQCEQVGDYLRDNTGVTSMKNNIALLWHIVERHCKEQEKLDICLKFCDEYNCPGKYPNSVPQSPATEE